MSLSEIEMGFVIASPVMAVAGICFAVTMSASPFVATIGKAIGWPLSIILGYMGAVHWGGALLPYWDDWASRLVMFGPGFFFCWMVTGIVFHDDAMEHHNKIARFITRRIRSFVGSKSKQGDTPKYKAYANKSRGDS
ncbi:MAG: hypothetical protein AAF986_08430 [Pseudomonadota bacterium]